MDRVRWGMVGCGDVTEVKSGPALQKARGSELVAVMRRDRDKAADYARRHGVPRFYGFADDLINDPEVDAVYVATPPSSHCEVALKAADAGKPCLVEKPMAKNYGECTRMVNYFQAKSVPLFVAYYRRALPRFLKVRELVRAGAVGKVTSVHIAQFEILLLKPTAQGWHTDPAIAGAGLFFDVASHGIDLLDFLLGPIKSAAGFAVNTGAAYPAEDVTAACFEFESGMVGTGVWNFNADHKDDRFIIKGTEGELRFPVFFDVDFTLTRRGVEEVFSFRNPPHIHQPFIQTVVNELLGCGTCESTGETGARASRVMDRCIASYYHR